MPYFTSESEFTAWVLARARENGWTAAHFGSTLRQVRAKNGGWRAVPDKNAAGFPDVIAVKDRVLFAELKMHDHRSKLSEAQLVWVKALREAGCEFYLWRPNDADEIADVFSGVPSRRRLVALEDLG